MFSTGMPEREHLQLTSFGLVVNEISDAIQEESAYTGHSTSGVFSTYTRLLS